MNKGIVIEVTEKDIIKANSIRKKNYPYSDDYRNNPVSVAISRKFHREAYVDGNYIEYKTSAGLHKTFIASKKVNQVMKSFCNNKSVKPFNFSLLEIDDITVY